MSRLALFSHRANTQIVTYTHIYSFMYNHRGTPRSQHLYRLALYPVFHINIVPCFNCLITTNEFKTSISLDMCIPKTSKYSSFSSSSIWGKLSCFIDQSSSCTTMQRREKETCWPTVTRSIRNIVLNKISSQLPGAVQWNLAPSR